MDKPTVAHHARPDHRIDDDTVDAHYDYAALARLALAVSDDCCALCRADEAGFGDFGELCASCADDAGVL